MATNHRLLPYVPRLALEWMHGGGDVTCLALPGSMVFVDISGFTKMSERLARRGKIGAEEVTEVMNATFSGLLTVAYEHGGGLLKFGGDALLLFFRGSEHPARAVRAAARMRGRLREVGRVQTSAGLVTLRMSVGVHTGDFHFFLAGREHRELIVTGPAASRTVEMESAAEAGDVLLSPECAALLPSRHRGKAKGPGILLRGEPPAPDAGEFSDPPLEGIELSDCVPAALRQRLLSGIGEPEHRSASIAFVHFDGTDEMITRDGMETVADRIDELVLAAQQAAAASGVTFLATDIDRDGGKIILVAGVPEARGEDEERILRAVRAIADAKCALPVRIGVNRGPIFAGDVGATYRRTYTVMGDAVNLAARLMAKAAPGQIIASPSVLDRSRTLFATTALEPFTVKGKAKPIHALDVGAIAGTRAETNRELPFVGRDRELALIADAIASARAGRGTVVDLVGEAGIGKTRLVGEIRRMAADMRFIQTAGEAYAASTPYFAFRRLLRELLDIHPDADPRENTRALTDRIDPVAPELLPWLPLIAVPLDVAVEATPEADAIDSSFRKGRIHDAVSDLLAALLPEPTILVFEDAYWLDDASRELLLHLESTRADSPWLVVPTRRPYTPGFEPERGMSCTLIKLEPLGESESATLAAGAMGDTPITPQQMRVLAERAGGNPLFLQELVATTAAGASFDALPDSIDAVVTARIDTLDPHDRTLLRYAAVLGSVFTPALARDVLAGEPIETNEAAWSRLGDFLVHEDEGRYRFLHAMFRDVAYEGLPFRRRRALHRRTGEILEARDTPERFAELLSLHFDRAGDFDKSWRYSSMAGDGAAAKYANIDAARFYRRALDAARRLGTIPDGEVARVAEALGDVSELAAMYPEAQAAYAQARRLTRVAGQDRAGLLMKEGVLRERAGKYADALRWYARGIRTLRDAAAPRGTAAKLTLASAGVRLRQGRFADCVRLCEQVVAANPEPERLAHAYYLLHLAHTSTGSPARARYRTLALPIYEQLGDFMGMANVLNNLGIDAYYEGRWDEATRLYRRGREAREHVGDAVGAALLDNNSGEIYLDQGRLDDAEPLFRQALAVTQSSGYRVGALLMRSNLARVAARRGETTSALNDLAETAELATEMNAEWFAVQFRTWLAECAVIGGDHETAMTVAEDAMKAAGNEAGSAVMRAALHRWIGYALAQASRYAQAQDAVDESIMIARASGASFEEALSHEAWVRIAGLTGNDAERDEHDAEARAIFERLGVVWTPSVPLTR
ncbi:MAG TPA: adenylate/guanylate cyclase domain-containing protein [Actinomycetota bacterium]|nr:adenylate/guanylate cyclase domain-containing protein [Actinomycetota bacterium]